MSEVGERARAWALTMAGHRGFDDIVHAHPSGTARIDIGEVVGREAREERENLLLRPGATRARGCLLYTSPSPRDATLSRMPSSA